MRLAGHVAGAEAVKNVCTAVGVDVEWERPNEKPNHGW